MKSFLTLLYFLFLINNTTFSQFFLDISEMEITIDSCVSKVSIGDGVNILSEKWGKLEGGGTNVYNGDSLVYFFKKDTDWPEFYVTLQMFKLKVETELPGEIFFPKFQIEIQFSDKNTYDNFLKEFTNIGYKFINEKKDKNWSRKRYQNENYSIDLISINSDTEIVYLFIMSNLIK